MAFASIRDSMMMISGNEKHRGRGCGEANRERQRTIAADPAGGCFF